MADEMERILDASLIDEHIAYIRDIVMETRGPYPCAVKPCTNGGVIRSMTDYELAGFLDSGQNEVYDQLSGKSHEDMTRDDWLNWLGSAV